MAISVLKDLFKKVKKDEDLAKDKGQAMQEHEHRHSDNDDPDHVMYDNGRKFADRTWIR